MGHKKSLNRRRVLKELYFSPSVSCADLYLKINKSFPLITKMLNELMKEGLVIETGYATSTGGRRPLTYAIKPDVKYIVSVAMDQFVTRIAFLDMQNRFVSQPLTFQLDLADEENALQILTEKIEESIFSSGISIEKFLGIGIGMPGFVNAKKSLNYTFLSGGEANISQHIYERVGIPVFIDNDSSLIALAERRFGAAKEMSEAMVINVGWGIGLGLILHGDLYRGHDGFAGELSHIPLFNNGKICSCGKSGCLETEASLDIIIQQAREGLQQGKPTSIKNLDREDKGEMIKEIMLAAQRGDRFAVSLFTEAGYNIGRGVAILIHLLNPQSVILSGRGSAAGKVLMAPVQQAINEYCIPRLCHNIDIRISGMGDKAELIGAAALVMENLDKIEKQHHTIEALAS